MSRITFRIAIALLTFVVGVAAVSLWFLFRRDVEERNTKVIEVKNNEWSKNQKVKWVYISDPLEFNEEFTEVSMTSARLIIFYEEGKWGFVVVDVEREKGKFRLSSSHDRFIQVGRWQVDEEGKVNITVDKCHCSNESIPSDGGTKVKYPVNESWFIEGLLGNANTILKSPNGNYRLIKKEELKEEKLEELISSPFEIRDEKSILWRECLKEDRR